ncbi:tetratricopeptide repeat protein 6 [Sorex araneus]|uniref:tetratricopeptide repeat protein 6 n=1 Tax=Sorex araneus TaxID=42254 RepID=UPI0024335AA7|nr:tetratricopeptide repeat protein 6 [Sorex araneus]
MDSVRKHFGLKHREEEYIFREHEKLRRASKKHSLRVRQELEDRPTVDRGLRGPYAVSQGSEESVICEPPQKPPSGSLRASRTGARSPRPPGRRPSGRAPPVASFRLREFYMSSSAFHRYQRQLLLPTIAPGAGTSRAMMLASPPARRDRPPAPSVAPKSSRSGILKPAVESPFSKSSKKPELRLPPRDSRLSGTRHSSSLSSIDSDLTATLLQRRVRFHPHLRRRSSSPSSGEPGRDAAEGPPRADPEPRVRPSQKPQLAARPAGYTMPTMVEDVIASLHSESQLATDRTIKELIWSILGPTYDFAPDLEVGEREKGGWVLSGQYAFRVRHERCWVCVLRDETPGRCLSSLDITPSFPLDLVQKRKLEQQPVSEELYGVRSSDFQLEPEDAIEWGISDTESLLKLQETFEIVPVTESSKLLESEQPPSDSKAAKRISLKKESSELLQIRGKEIKHIRRAKLEISEEKRLKSLQFLRRKKLRVKRITKERTFPTLHVLCKTFPAHQLPLHLSLASRVYHTPSRKGHETLVGQLGASLFGSCIGDEDKDDRLLRGIPNMVNEEENAAIFTMPPAHKPQLQLLGKEMSAYPGFTKFLWNSASPKFSVPVSVIKETVYPKYESAQASRILLEKFSVFKKQYSISSSSLIRKHFILKKSASFENIPKHFSTKSLQLKRAKSAIELRKEEKASVSFEIKNDMQSNIREVLFQRAKELEHYKTIHTESDKTVEKNIDTVLAHIQENIKSGHLSFSLVEASKQAGISYIVYPKKTKKKEKNLRFTRLPFVFDELAKPPKILQRSMSQEILPGQKKFLLRVPVYERQLRSPSLPMVLNFDEFVLKKGGNPKTAGLRSWVFNLFSKYTYHKEDPQIPKMTTPKEYTLAVQKLPMLELSDSLESDLAPEIIQYYNSEVEKLTEEINNKTKYPAFLYCRRGAIYRKLGKLQSAMHDLQKAILLEPLFLNAYWHRHFIYLFQDKYNDALDDLNYIIKHNKNNAEAYLSKAEIYKARNDITLAILNYTQGIKRKPTDADAYFRRGELYEMENKILAIDDFSKCIFYDSKRTDALMKRGLFYYENEMWQQAIQDFTDLLDLDPQNSQARTYRGSAYYKRNSFRQATEDFSFAIHLDPNNWLAMYYRACLFRKTKPMRALQDYSVSALINDGYENLNCFLHRGILYAELKFWLMALCDFEVVISLDRNFVSAYINIGLIYLLYLDNYIEAVRNFSEAIKIDPFHIQSYICQAHAFDKLHKLTRSLKEISRAIHLQPDEVELYIIRGQYLVKMKCYDLAKFTIQQVTEMNKGLINLSPLQKALVYSFCDKYDKAIQVLDGITLQKPEITTYTLLAKTLMKAKRNKEALKMFKKALGVFSQSSKGPDATEASADCLYHLGLCYVEEGNSQMAYDCFTKAVKAKPDFAEGFYQRGLCKVKLGKNYPILDFNRAITLDSNHYQAYLSRAAYYGLKGRYSKAILNCNEAIKICSQNVFAYIYRGVLKYYNKTYKLAIKDLTIAVSMDKNSYIAFYNRAICYTQVSEYAKALIDYGIVLLLDSGETIVLNTFINRGRIYTELKQYHFALEDFKTAAEMQKTNANFYYATAECHYRIKEFEEAVHFFSHALSLDIHFLDAYIGRGNSYVEYGDDKATKQAQKDFIRALHFCPSYLRARICFAYNLQAQGKFQKAWNHFTIAIDSDPKSYKAYEGRAVVCLQMGDYFAAIQDINIAVKINTTAEFLTNRGVIHEFMGQQQNAMKDYQAALSLNPTYSLAYFNAGNIYFHHRQFSQARDYFSKALKFDPENECAALNRAITNTLLKKYEEAKEDFRHIAEICPFWSAVYFNRAHYYCCLKQFELAEEDYSKALSLKPNDTLIYNLRAEVRGKLGHISEAMADYNKALDLQDYALVK